ncbi:MAG: hypothetical protein ACUVTW_15550, partial [Thermogutta sp.]
FLARKDSRHASVITKLLPSSDTSSHTVNGYDPRLGLPAFVGGRRNLGDYASHHGERCAQTDQGSDLHRFHDRSAVGMLFPPSLASTTLPSPSDR